MARRNTITPARLRSVRIRLGLSQKEFAQSVGVDQRTVSEWELGHAPRFFKILNVAQRIAYLERVADAHDKLPE
jgi:transcriptional regulator with XRE-family HTH domain